MQDRISTKFKAIESDMIAIINKLGSDQLFVRWLKNLNQYPLEQSAGFDDSGVEILQPDFASNYDLVGNGDICPYLFMPTIVTDAHPYIFFSHLEFRSSDSSSALVTHTYVMDILVPYSQIMVQDKLRNIRIIDRIMVDVDNTYITGIGRLFIHKGRDYVANDTYQGATLTITIDNSRVSG
jgi:hypothetical protein